MTSSSGLASSATQYHKASTRKEAAGTSLSPDQRDESTQESQVCDATVHINEHGCTSRFRGGGESSLPTSF